MTVRGSTTAARGRARRVGCCGLALAAALLARPDDALARGGEATAGAPAALVRQVAEAAAAKAIRLPASSVMRVGEERLPPAGYLDYCLRFRVRDQGCAL
jgi:hypothetical protein